MAIKDLADGEAWLCALSAKAKLLEGQLAETNPRVTGARGDSVTARRTAIKNELDVVRAKYRETQREVKILRAAARGENNGNGRAKRIEKRLEEIVGLLKQLVENTTRK